MWAVSVVCLIGLWAVVPCAEGSGASIYQLVDTARTEAAKQRLDRALVEERQAFQALTSAYEAARLCHAAKSSAESRLEAIAAVSEELRPFARLQSPAAKDIWRRIAGKTGYLTVEKSLARNGVALAGDCPARSFEVAPARQRYAGAKRLTDASREALSRAEERAPLSPATPGPVPTTAKPSEVELARRSAEALAALKECAAELASLNTTAQSYRSLKKDYVDIQIAVIWEEDDGKQAADNALVRDVRLEELLERVIKRADQKVREKEPSCTEKQKAARTAALLVKTTTPATALAKANIDDPATTSTTTTTDIPTTLTTASSTTSTSTTTNTPPPPAIPTAEMTKPKSSKQRLARRRTEAVGKRPGRPDEGPDATVNVDGVPLNPHTPCCRKAAAGLCQVSLLVRNSCNTECGCRRLTATCTGRAPKQCRQPSGSSGAPRRPACVDTDAECGAWAADGQCSRRIGFFMQNYCRKSCDKCPCAEDVDEYHCWGWAMLGECGAESKDWMARHCGTSCCDGGRQLTKGRSVSLRRRIVARRSAARTGRRVRLARAAWRRSLRAASAASAQS